ncbi:Outer membrane usher protein PapC precursor [compost metagenome]
MKSVTQATLTEGAIGYRSFDVIAGEKGMVTLRLANNDTPPFGASAQNSRGQETGIVGDEGSVYLSGMKAGESMSLHWDGKARCNFTLPDTTDPLQEQPELLCQPTGDQQPAA